MPAPSPAETAKRVEGRKDQPHRNPVDRTLRQNPECPPHQIHGVERPGRTIRTQGRVSWLLCTVASDGLVPGARHVRWLLALAVLEPPRFNLVMSREQYRNQLPKLLVSDEILSVLLLDG
jgi:hypothetical protein